jgi:hypothetical protein
MSVPSSLDPDQSWRILGLVTEWIKHAEAKAAGTLAAASVSGGILYSLVENQASAGFFLSVSAVICCALIIAGGLSAAWALRPRLWSREAPKSSLYFNHIAKAHPKKAGSAAYLDALRLVTASHEALVAEIADQIWANAQVAKTKYAWASVGLAFILLAIVALGATTLAVALNSR